MAATEKQGAPPPGAVELTTIPVPQLRSIQSQLSSEVEHLTTSHTKLQAALVKFHECVRSISNGVNDADRSEILVPLTPSLYVKGKMADREKVIVDVGTGFFVEKTTPKAVEFYKTKIEELQKNISDLAGVLKSKSANAAIVEDVLRQKILLESENAAKPEEKKP